MLTYRFSVRKSRIHGAGLFAGSAIAARRKFGELQGEIISQREARRRAKSRAVIAIVEFGDGQALDALHGNDFRFVNHSCRPNAFLRIYRQRVEFYALRDIRRGEEITVDYGETQHDGALRCGCGSNSCRRQL